MGNTLPSIMQMASLSVVWPMVRQSLSESESRDEGHAVCRNARWLNRRSFAGSVCRSCPWGGQDCYVAWRLFLGRVIFTMGSTLMARFPGIARAAQCSAIEHSIKKIAGLARRITWL